MKAAHDFLVDKGIAKPVVKITQFCGSISTAITRTKSCSVRPTIPARRAKALPKPRRATIHSCSCAASSMERCRPN